MLLVLSGSIPDKGGTVGDQGIVGDTDLEQMDKAQLLAEALRLRTAIRMHRNAKGDDRCWENDLTLYDVLPEGSNGISLVLPPCTEFFTNCIEYYKRQTEIRIVEING